MIYGDLEFQLADTVADFLRASIADETQEDALVVTFYDPRSVDEAHRIVVMVPQGATNDHGGGNCSFELLVEVRSRWNEATITEDFASHRARLKEVRAALEVDAGEICEELSNDEIGVDGFHVERSFRTDVDANNWIVSETGYRVNCFTKDATE